MQISDKAPSRMNFKHEELLKSEDKVKNYTNSGAAKVTMPHIPSTKSALTSKRPFWRSPLNIITLFIPNAISILYFGVFSSPVYVSTSSLIVTNPVKDTDSLTSLLSGSSGSSSDGAYVLKSFIGSWDEYRRIDAQYDLAHAYSNGDLYARYGGLGMLFHNNDVARWHYYQNQVAVDVDERSGITTINVRGFAPNVASGIARTVVADAIAHINSMNQASEDNFVSTAKKHADALRDAITADELALSAFRSDKGIYDPEQYSEALLTEVQSLTAKNIDLNAQYQALTHGAANNPMAYNYQSQMAVLEKAISGVNHNAATIAQITPAYNALTLRRETDITLLKQAEIAAQEASFKAGQNHYSLNMISAPSEPHAPELPHRLWRVLEVAAVTVLVRLIAG